MAQGRGRKAILIVAVLLLVIVLIYSGLRLMESTVSRAPTGATEGYHKKTIIRDGVEYYPRLDVTVLLVSGIDETGPMVDSGSYNNPGEADMVSLLIFSEEKQCVDILSLNRDTMMDIPVMGINGKPAGSIKGQLALAHTYGSGLKDSSENLKKCVSDFLYGIDIDYYLTMNMDAIAILNDGIGGVTVNVKDDFSQVDASIPMGQVTLTGKQAVTFVRTRMGVGNQLNLSRMERHKAVSDYIVTDCSATSLSSLLSSFNDYEIGEIITIDGENVKGEEFMEYHVDQEDLDRIVLEYLYAPKEN